MSRCRATLHDILSVRFTLKTQPVPRVIRLLAFVFLCRYSFAQAQNQLDSSQALFTVLAAINASGYDTDLDSPSNHPLRAAIRQAVAARNPPSLAALRRFYEAHPAGGRQQQFSQYVTFGLCLEEPPKFKFRYPAGQLPPDVQALAGFEVLLKQFYEEAGIAELWRRSQPAILELLARYQPRIIEDVRQVNLYLRNPTSGARFKRFQIFVEPLAAPNITETRTYMDDYFVVLTPSPQPNFDLIRRAYLHYLIDPMMLANSEKLSKKRPLIDLAQASPILEDIYKEDYSLLSGMSLVLAVEARLAPISQRQALVALAMSEGFILTACFFEALPAYEKDERSMRFYVGELIDGIDLAREDKRIAKVEFASRKTARVVRSQVKAPEPTPIELADALYEQRDLAGARAAYRKIIEGGSARPVHARAYYGLARIAVLEKDPELAEKLFEKAQDLDPEPAVKAWLHIYLARLAAAAGEQERAVEQYKAALAVEGSSDTARAYAQKELQAAQARLKE